MNRSNGDYIEKEPRDSACLFRSKLLRRHSSLLAKYDKQYHCILTGKSIKFGVAPPCYENADLQYKCGICNIEEQVRSFHSEPAQEITPSQLQCRRDLHLGIKSFLLYECIKAPAEPQEDFKNYEGVFMGLEPEEELKKKWPSVPVRKVTIRKVNINEGIQLVRTTYRDDEPVPAWVEVLWKKQKELLIDSDNRCLPYDFRSHPTISKQSDEYIFSLFSEKERKCRRTELSMKDNEIPPCYWGRYFNNPCHVCRIECAALRTEPGAYRTGRPLTKNQKEIKAILHSVYLLYSSQDDYVLKFHGITQSEIPESSEQRARSESYRRQIGQSALEMYETELQRSATARLENDGNNVHKDHLKHQNAAQQLENKKDGDDEHQHVDNEFHNEEGKTSEDSMEAAYGPMLSRKRIRSGIINTPSVKKS